MPILGGALQILIGISVLVGIYILFKNYLSNEDNLISPNWSMLAMVYTTLLILAVINLVSGIWMLTIPFNAETALIGYVLEKESQDKESPEGGAENTPSQS